MIKGKYVALVEVDIRIPERQGLRPFEEMKDMLMKGYVTSGMKKVIESEVFDKDFCDVKVTQWSADLYQVDVEADK